jgi:NADP-dependent 3-hydroxy acid dehydrogenase YdfG
MFSLVVCEIQVMFLLRNVLLLPLLLHCCCQPAQAISKGLPLRVSAISPGLVETNFFKVRAFGDEEAARAAVSSMQCLQPSDVAEAVLWCLSAPAHMNVCDVVVRPTEQLI